MSSREITKCRSCGCKVLTPVLSLGDIYVVDFGEKGGVKAPLDLVLCGDCKLLQLKHTVDQNLLFDHYYYESGVNQSMRDALKDVVNTALKRVELKSEDVVIDIGSNDGTLLRCYPQRDIWRVGFEPAKNLAEKAKDTGTIINDFFSAKKLREWRGMERPKAKIITAIAVFYDLDDPNTFLEDIRQTLAWNGVFIIQQNYLPTMLENVCVDNIVHEHLEYYSLTTLSRLLTENDLVIQDVEFNNVNGGSFRVYVRHQSHCSEVKSIVKETLRKEAEMGLDKGITYYEFAREVERLRSRLHDFIKKLVDKGMKVYAYGASTRGNTLLQICGLDNKLIKAALERNPVKWGTQMVGTNIPVISEEEGRRLRPDYLLILPWQFLGEFVERERDYLLKGGRFIVPLPQPSYILEAHLLE